MLTDERNDGKENLNVNKMVKYSEFESTQVISEAQLLLHCGSPIDENQFILSQKESPMKTLDSSSCLASRSYPLSAIKKTETRKSVRFNMEKNVTFSVQPDVYHSPDSDSDSTVENDQCFGRDSLGISDDEDSEDDDDDDDRNVQSIVVKRQMGEIDEMEKEKDKLAKDLQHLRKRHEKEMQQLCEEYKRRREEFYDELDEVQQEMNHKRNAYNMEFSQIQDEAHLKERKEAHNDEKRKVEEKEEELKQKREHVLEQEKELKEYEAYLERRHKSLNKKEEDLCLLQDELEDLSDVLKEEEKRAKLKQEKLLAPVKECHHDEAEIEKTRILLNNSLMVEHEMIEKLRERDDEVVEKSTKIIMLEEEKRKLETKIKHLETQMSINLSRPSPSPSLAITKTSFKLLTSGSIPVDEKTGGRLPPKTSPASPRRTEFGIASPKRFLSQTSTGSPRNSFNECCDDEETGHHLDDTLDILDTEELYSADTTSPRRTLTKTNFSKTCVLM